MKTWMIAVLLPLIWGCDDQGLPPDDTPEPVVTVQFLEASCTEAWLRLAPRNVSPPYTLTLLRNDSTVATFPSPPADTTVIDEGLVPSRTYTYRARLTSPSGLHLTGDPVQARTLDTTSHQFTWETTVLGEGGASVLYDVAIVNDTLAYAVGEVYLRDSSGVLDPTAYNLATWDGTNWRLSRVLFPLCDANGNQVGSGPYAGKSVFASSGDDIWFTCAVSLVHWDGAAIRSVCMPLGYGQRDLSRLWGVRGSLFLVGTNGFIAHFDGLTWRRVESGTTLNINDVWGAAVGQGGDQLLGAVAWNRSQSQGNALLRLSPTGASGLVTTGLPYGLSGLWFVPERIAYVVGGAIARKRSLVDTTSWQRYAYGEVTIYFINTVHGQGLNDVVAAGAFGEVLHFNGMTWRSFIAETGMPGNYWSIKIRGRHVFAVGTGGRILHGIRP
jgi:hypothetical protein